MRKKAPDDTAIPLCTVHHTNITGTDVRRGRPNTATTPNIWEKTDELLRVEPEFS